MPASTRATCATCPVLTTCWRCPASIGVDARAFLAAHAPELTVDNVVRALGRRAAQLEPLWNEWGQVRPTLLSDRHSLGSVPG